MCILSSRDTTGKTYTEKKFEKHFTSNMQSKPRLEFNKEFSTMSDLSEAWKCSSLTGLGLASIALMHLQKNVLI